MAKEHGNSCVKLKEAFPFDYHSQVQNPAAIPLTGIFTDLKTSKMTDRDKFIQNYTGSYDPGKYYDYLQEVKANEQRYANATFNKAENQRMLKEANKQSYNKHLRN